MTSSSNRDAWPRIGRETSDPRAGDWAGPYAWSTKKALYIFRDHLQLFLPTTAILLTNVGGPIYPAGRGNELARSTCSTCQCAGPLPNSPACNSAWCWCVSLRLQSRAHKTQHPISPLHSLPFRKRRPPRSILIQGTLLRYSRIQTQPHSGFPARRTLFFNGILHSPQDIPGRTA